MSDDRISESVSVRFLSSGGLVVQVHHERVRALAEWDAAARLVRHECRFDAEPVPSAEPPIDPQPATDCRGNPIKGAVGLAKAYLGLDKADDATARRRWEICTTCEHFDLGLCRLCGCHLSAKVRLASQSCPATPPRWAASQ
ncbi:MAG: hypothetical protein IT442_18005 [Phycisphaeraceae bacterium]|nr:hypothetical protein [Phycisphaeraceae bacterium]